MKYRLEVFLLSAVCILDISLTFHEDISSEPVFATIKQNKIYDSS